LGIGHIGLAHARPVNGALSRNGELWTNPEILNVTFHNYTRAYVTSDYRLRQRLTVSLLD
jgi:hypothetical protein